MEVLANLSWNLSQVVVEKEHACFAAKLIVYLITLLNRGLFHNFFFLTQAIAHSYSLFAQWDVIVAPSFKKPKNIETYKDFFKRYFKILH